MSTTIKPLAQLEDLEEDGSARGPLLQMTGIVKSYGTVRALDGVDFDLRVGEVHGLLGQNGAGKSTLIKILAGVERRSSGSIRIRGRAIDGISPHAARESKIAVVYQDLSLIPTMTVAANLFLGREPRNSAGLVDKRALMRRAREVVQRYGLPLRVEAPVASLSFAHRQLTEIVKALLGECDILVLDEPTSSLTADEEQVLFDAVRDVAARGVGVIYVTHRLPEIFALTQRVTVLRDGRNVATLTTSESSLPELVDTIVGDRTTVAPARSRPPSAASTPSASMLSAPVSSEPVVRMESVSNSRLRAVNLAVRAGEIIGLAGSIGSGRTELLETMFGLRPVTSGSLWIGERQVVLRDCADAIRLGVALVPEDRHQAGLVLQHSVERNVALPHLARFSRSGIFQRREARRRSNAVVRQLGVKTPDVNQPVGMLSGGNQQKVVFGKWLAPAPRVLLLDEPTVGVDVGARAEIYEAIRAMASTERVAVVVVSSDFDELLLLCHTIALVADGAVPAVRPRSEIRSEQHLHHLVQEQR